MTDNKVDLIVEVCEDCFRVVGKNGNKGGQRVPEDASDWVFLPGPEL